MSLGVVVKGPEGVVLAADSRVTLMAGPDPANRIHVNYDNATKLLTLDNHPMVAAVTYGTAVIGLRTAHSFLPEFDVELKKEANGRRLTIVEYAQRLSSFFLRQWNAVPQLQNWQGPRMTFVVAGYDPDAPYGSVFLFEIPGAPNPVEMQVGDNFGMTWGGQHDIASRMLQGYDPSFPTVLANALGRPEEEIVDLLTRQVRPQLEFRIPYQALPLQDCVDLAIFLIRTTVTAQEFAVGLRGVGGPIDVAYITRTHGLRWVQQKLIRGEEGIHMRGKTVRLERK